MIVGRDFTILDHELVNLHSRSDCHTKRERIGPHLHHSGRLFGLLKETGWSKIAPNHLPLISAMSPNRIRFVSIPS